MSVPMFLVEGLPETDTLTLDGPEGHHAATVARLRQGERLLLGDGRGTTALATVLTVAKASLRVRVDSLRNAPPALPRLVVVQGIAKGERGELAVQAMTEVGVDEVVPWAAARSVVSWRGERAYRARQRWVDTAREATKQSRRAWLPDIAEAHGTADVCARLVRAGGGIVLHEEADEPLATMELPTDEDLAAAGEVLVVVGPEGGIAPDEAAAFEAAGARLARLGDTVLRTSTAGVVALAVLSARLGRW